jgi:assimilatory nitrate reductase catalytic subunit
MNLRGEAATRCNGTLPLAEGDTRSNGTLAAEAKTLTVLPREDFPTNKGGLCRKGWTSTELLTHPDRLTKPLMRDVKGDALRAVTWEAALGRVAAGIRDARARYGSPDAVAVFGGGGLTNEKAYLLGKFARIAIQTSQIDYNGRFCMASAAAAANRAFGLDRGMPFPLADIASAQTVLLVGSNCAETMPPIMQYFDEQRRRGGRLIVADPRRTPTAAAAHLHLQLTPGTDGALANGLLHIASMDGLLDHDFIAARTSGYEAVRRAITAYWPDRVERITGVPVARLREAAHLLGEAPTAMTLTARGPEQQSKGVDNTLAFINLMLALGKAGRPGSGWGCLTGQGNGQGGREHGQKSDQLPGYRLLADPAARAHVASVWGVDPDTLPKPGRSAWELLDALGQDGGPHVLLVFGSNPVVSAPNAGHIDGRLASLDLLVVADPFLSETAAQADVVLPVAQWAEEDGTMTNLEGRVLRRRRALPPPDGVRTDAEVLVDLAERLGKGAYFPTSEPAAIFDELRRASAGGLADYAGITWERIDREDGVFWPCPSEDHPGTPRLFLDRFAHSDGRARFFPIAHRPAAEEPDDDFPLYLTTGRVMAQYQSGTQTRRVRALNEAAPEPFVEVHPTLGRHFGIADGDIVRVVTRRGGMLVCTRLTPTIRQDTLFIPFHWAGSGRANLLTNPALDPISRMPEFKVCAARLELRSP